MINSKVFLFMCLFVTNFAWAHSDAINTEMVLLKVAPGLVNSRVMAGSGALDGKKVENCMIVVHQQPNQLDLTFIADNKFVDTLSLNNTLQSFEDSEGEEKLEVAYISQKSKFQYFHSIGSRTNQYIGANDYELEISKTSANSFVVSYLHAWADDDGGYGSKKFECDLKSAP